MYNLKYISILTVAMLCSTFRAEAQDRYWQGFGHGEIEGLTKGLATGLAVLNSSNVNERKGQEFILYDTRVPTLTLLLETTTGRLWLLNNESDDDYKYHGKFAINASKLIENDAAKKCGRFSLLFPNRAQTLYLQIDKPSDSFTWDHFYLVDHNNGRVWEGYINIGKDYKYFVKRRNFIREIKEKELSEE